MSLTIAVMAAALATATAPVAEASTAAAPEPPTVRPAPDAVKARAERLLSAMTQSEKLSLVKGLFGSVRAAAHYLPPPEARMGSAGYLPGVPRLGVPPIWETDAGLGVSTQRDSLEPYRQRTSLPSGLATAATFDPALARRGGEMIGLEARESGFNVQLAGGVDLVREPRNGRNFEYAGEDPLLAGTIVGAEVNGVQSNHIISTVKHYALNAQETGRMILSSKLSDDQARMSDLLAFQIAIEASDPGAVMCAYNRVNAVYACENADLLGVLKHDWGYRGFVMSDWGAVHSTVRAAMAGLDQESAAIFDDEPYFGAPLERAIAEGRVPQARLDDMVLRILRAMIRNGLLDHPVQIGPIDFTADARVSQADAEEAIVLLRNQGHILPLARSARRIAVIGGGADLGVIAGGGSSTVFPKGGGADPTREPKTWPGPVVFDPPSPLAAIRARAGASKVVWNNGSDIAAAARAAADSDVAIVFATQWTAESQDAAMALDGRQDALIAAVAAANPRTIVVLETGGPVRMPWLDKTSAVLEAWYAGSGGGEAIARVLFGEVDASGRLPVTFPRDESQLPRPHLLADGQSPDKPFTVDYDIEGAAVGYKWFDRQGLEPLFPFGYGQSYTTFAYSDLKATVQDDRVVVSFSVRNTGARPGKAVPQIYVSPRQGGWEAPKRLGGWAKLELQPGETRQVSVGLDPRLLSVWHERSHAWRVAGGDYDVLLATSAREVQAHTLVRLAPTTLAVGTRPSCAGTREGAVVTSCTPARPGS